MRADKAKSLSKVSTELLKDPLLTEREIAKNTGIGNGTVHRAIEELEQTGAKDPKIIIITDKDLDIVKLGQNEIDRRLQNREELDKMRTVEISQVIKESTARYSLFRGNATDKQGGLKDFTSGYEMLAKIKAGELPKESVYDVVRMLKSE